MKVLIDTHVIAIKTRLGKLNPGLSLEEISDYVEAVGL
jgi:hypothetical protein